MFSTHLKTVLIAAVIVSLPIPTLAEVKKEGVGGRYNQLVSTELQAILKTAGAGEGYKLEGKKMFLFLAPKKAGVAKQSQQKRDRLAAEAKQKEIMEV